MPITLVRDASGTEHFSGNNDDFWPVSFDHVVDGPIDAHLDDYDVVIPSDELREQPRLGGGVRVALFCTCLEALEHLRSFDEGADIVFQPTLLARLDRHRAIRSTLVVTRAMDAGALLKAGDLTTENGGLGLSAEMRATVIGRPLLYDLPSGSAVDFGVVGARGEGAT